MGGDLHCHTKLSDGSLGIEDLVLLAKKKGIETIAITDHDCLAGTVRGKRRYTLLSQRRTGQAPGTLPQKLACP